MWHAADDGDDANLIRGDRRIPVEEAQRLPCFGDGVEHETERHLRSNRMQPVLEPGHHAEVPAPAAHRPEEVGVFVGIYRSDLTIGRDQLHAEQIVATQPIFVAQPASAAAQGQPGDASLGDQAARSGQPVFLGRAVHVGPGQTGLGADGARRRIHVKLLHR